MTWNVDGFNDPACRITITSYLWRQDVDIAVITESHLRDEDNFTDLGESKERHTRIRLDHYQIAHWRNREPETDHRCGGVLILSRPGIDCTLIPRDLLPRRPLSCCSLIVTAVGGCCQPFRLTGVYLPPPTAKVTSRDVASLLDDHTFCYWNGQRLNHPICGDMNPPSCREDFEEWAGERGLWELSDPAEPTFSSGNALNRFLLGPGEDVWGRCFPTPSDRRKQMAVLS